jgi:DNA-binding transcriptional regulator YiaG
MKKTVQINFFGFPIVIVDCPHIDIDGNMEPAINYNKLEAMMFDALPFKPSKLNGAEIKFIRLHLDMTQKQFGEWLMDRKHPSAISGWEECGLEATNMDDATERSLRLQLIDHINQKKRRTTINLHETMQRLTLSIRKRQQKKIELDANYVPIPGTGLAPDSIQLAN